MTTNEYLKDKKILVMGLGLLGGGVATTRWLVKHGAKVTVTDLKTKKELADSIKALGPAVKKIRFVLGRHTESDFRSHQIVVVNPAVPRLSPLLKIAHQSGAALENEASLFFRFCQNPAIGVTGTKGKTTTANWIYHFLKQKYPRSVLAGNSSENPMLKALDKLDGVSPVVVELSSWHLELLTKSERAPHIAIITNIYPDHLNRYENITEYALAKANIFKHQTGEDFLILNKKNKWTQLFLKQSASWRTKSQTLFIPYPIFPFSPPFIHFGDHNLQNLLTAALAANLAGVSWNSIKKAARTLPQIKFREEVIYQKNGLTVVNDTTATSPDATIAALTRFTNHRYQGQTLILIAGGTDKNLEFDDWARAVKKFITPDNLFLLEGSATARMLDSLNRIGYFKKTMPRLYLNFNVLLTSGLKHAKMIKSKKILLFSPGAASFEKFKNEFDRGNQFNKFFLKERR